MPMRLTVILLLGFLAACERQAPAPSQDAVQRVAIVGEKQRQAMAELSPDTSEAIWQVSEDGQAIHFGDTGEPPLLTLGCDVGTVPFEFVIIRHAKAFPGQGALFPIIGNGINARFPVDAVLADGEWHWEARLPADDPQLEVFSGTRDIVATLPGRGTLEIDGGRIAGEFLEWCRAGGVPDQAVTEPPQTDEN